MAEESLYERLGGRAAIESVVDEFYDRVLADEDVNHHFEDVDMEALRNHQKLFIESVTGGPAEYDGREMADAHAGLGITEAEFDVVAEHLDGALAAHDVPDDDREAVLSQVAGLKPAIVSA